MAPQECHPYMHSGRGRTAEQRQVPGYFALAWQRIQMSDTLSWAGQVNQTWCKEAQLTEYVRQVGEPGEWWYCRGKVSRPEQWVDREVVKHIWGEDELFMKKVDARDIVVHAFDWGKTCGEVSDLVVNGGWGWMKELHGGGNDCRSQWNSWPAWRD